MAKKAAGIHEVDPIVSLSAWVSALANQIIAFTTKESTIKEAAMVAITSYMGDGVGVRVEQEQCQYINNWNFNYQPNNNLPTHYHLGLKNHENFSYTNPRNALQPPPGFPQPLAEKKPYCGEILSTFIMETRGRLSIDEPRLDSIETYCNNLSATMKSLEVQVGQLATKLKNQQKGKFPNDIEQNPIDHCKAITLRSGKEVESSRQEEKNGKEAEVEVEVEIEAKKAKPAEASKPRGISFPNNSPIISPPLPFP